MRQTNISLTSFVDFLSATGTARITCVREAKRRYEATYTPEVDYYKGWRDRADKCFGCGWNADNLKTSLATVLDSRKFDNYEACRQGLTKWVGRKRVVLLPPVRSSWTGANGALSVTINPELHVDVNGKPYVVKYYLRDQPITKQKANTTLHLLSKFAPQGEQVGLLDVRRGKLYTPTVNIADVDALLEGDALAFKTIWDSI